LFVLLFFFKPNKSESCIKGVNLIEGNEMKYVKDDLLYTA